MGRRGNIFSRKSRSASKGRKHIVPRLPCGLHRPRGEERARAVGASPSALALALPKRMSFFTSHSGRLRKLERGARVKARKRLKRLCSTLKARANAERVRAVRERFSFPFAN